MSKKKARELDNFITLSGGVTVEVLPFPAGLWEDVQDRALEKFPDPVPPKKTIKVVDGTEQVDDLTNPEYLKKKALAEEGRERFTGEVVSEAVVDLCINVNLAEYEHLIKRFERYSGKFSEDPDDRKMDFLTKAALRNKADYERVVAKSVTLMAVGDPEVVRKLESFRDNLEGTIITDNASSSADEGKQLEVEAEIKDT